MQFDSALLSLFFLSLCEAQASAVTLSIDRDTKASSAVENLRRELQDQVAEIEGEASSDVPVIAIWAHTSVPIRWHRMGADTV